MSHSKLVLVTLGPSTFPRYQRVGGPSTPCALATHSRLGQIGNMRTREPLIPRSPIYPRRRCLARKCRGGGYSASRFRLRNIGGQEASCVDADKSLCS